ncbi:acyl-CoA dehydrogenase [Halobacteriales archaeon QS_8_69_26]|nr:MAG: acyl-CoA dehydrogenase [Halobacteriales archaeon QS_8_69_26]
MDRPIDYGRYEKGRHLNYWEVDRVLQWEVRRTYPGDELAFGVEQLSSFGEAVGQVVADNSDYVDDHGPELHTYDEHGEVRNEVRYPAEHRENEEIAYGHGIVADSFRAPPGREEPLSKLHNLAMEYLLSYADGGLTCPVAMTAGVALVLEKFDDGDLAEVFEGLTARSAEEVVEGAMFLTEKQGGSDVGATETVARRDDEGNWRLYGEKWFCSNVDAEAKLVLARREGAPEGTDGLSLFLVPHTVDGEPNDMLCRRLKDKLGTVSVPTGEVELDGSLGYLVGETERGFKYMTEMLNLERLSNAVAACAHMGRALLEATVHAANREAFGTTIDQFPLMREDLVDMAVDHEAATAYSFEAARVFAERERTGDDDAYRLMRALVPVAKYRTGRMAVDTCSYAMEVLGGNGYVDDFVTNRLLRDAQVLPIWEGTSNILSLDLLRALDREDAHEPLLAEIDRRLDAAEHPYLADLAAEVREEYHALAEEMAALGAGDEEYAQSKAKRLADHVFEVFTAALLVAEAQQRIDDGDARKALVAERFVDNYLREGRGISDGDRFPLEHFDAVVRFAPVDPEQLHEAVPADD